VRGPSPQPSPRGRERKCSGQAMSEMALIIPLLLVFILGAAEFSNLMMTALRTAGLSREAANAGFRDCGFLSVNAADTCLETITDKVLTGANLTLSNFATRGNIIASIYEKKPNQPTTLILQKSKGSGGYSSRYSAGSIDVSIAAKQERIVVAEVVYRYLPLTAIQNFLNLVGFPSKIYEVTIY